MSLIKKKTKKADKQQNYSHVDKNGSVTERQYFKKAKGLTPFSIQAIHFHYNLNFHLTLGDFSQSSTYTEHVQLDL